MSDLLTKLKTNEGFKKYFFNTSWVILEKIFRLFIAFFISVYVARYLGPNDFGILNYAISFVGLFSTIASLGVDNILVIKLVSDRSKRDILLGTAFSIKLVGSLLMLSLLAITVNFASNTSSTNIFIFIIAATAIFNSFNVIDFYFQANVLSKNTVVIQMIVILISSILKLLFIYLQFTLICFVLIVLVESIILATGLIYKYTRHKLSLLKWRFDWSLVKDFIFKSWPLIFSALLIQIHMKIDQVIIKELLGNLEVGIYAAAARISETWNFLPIAIVGSLMPAIIKAKTVNESQYIDRLVNLFNLLTICSIPIAIFFTIFGEFTINALYGEEYSDAGKVLSIHIWTSVFYFFGTASRKWLLIESSQKRILYFTFIQATSNLTLNFLLIPKFGILGAAYSTLIAEFLASYLMYLFLKETRLIFIIKTKSILKFISLKIFFELYFQIKRLYLK